MCKNAKKMELLAPAGNLEKLEAALYFGADAVYFGGKDYSLRAYADNFDLQQMQSAAQICHENGKKAYVAVNILAHNADFEGLSDYFAHLEGIGIDAVIVADIGVASVLRKAAPKIGLHISTQANVTNKYSAMEFVRLGAQRIVLARELSLVEMAQIADHLGDSCELEAFVHGAMCVSYSGRCLLSNFLTQRSSNKGECVQACRWFFKPLRASGESSNNSVAMELCEESRGAYILNSMDLCLIKRLKDLMQAGISSLKIEGRMKTSYYVANTVNAYRRALQCLYSGAELGDLQYEVLKSSHRTFCEGFLDGRGCANVDIFDSQPKQSHTFCAVVNGVFEGGLLATHRNKFSVGDEMEILSPNQCFNATFTVQKIVGENGAQKQCADRVQERLRVYSSGLDGLDLRAGDILRRKD